MPIKSLLVTLCLLFCYSSDVHAGAAVQRQQQMKGAQQQAQEEAQYQAQQQMYQQAIAERQQAEVQAYQQAVAQYQAAQIQAARQYIMAQVVQAQVQAQVNAYVQQTQLQAAQQVALKQAVEEELARRVAAKIAQGQAAQVQQAMIAEVMAEVIKRQTIDQVQQVQAVQQIGAVQQYQAAQEHVAAQQYIAGARRPYDPATNEDVQDIVDVAQVWDKLNNNSKAWTLLIDDQAKVMTVNEFIERYRKEQVMIRQPPAHYAQMTDDMLSQNPQMLLKPFKEILQILAIMEYDFDNGMDKDNMVRRLLGEAAYQSNKKRLGK